MTGLNHAMEQVKEFHRTFGHPVEEAPTRLAELRKNARTSWMQEELDEYYAAQTIYDEADALIDLIYFALGTFVEMGIKPQQIFDIVQKANMDKVWPDGTVHRREDGKVQKPPEWEAPEPKIIAEIDRQASE